MSEDYNKNDPNKTWDFPSGTPGVTLGELSDYRTLVLYNFFVNKGVLPNQLKRQRGSISTNYNGTPLKVTYNK